MADTKKPQLQFEEELEKTLGQFRPTPSPRFYRKMEKAPWRKNRYSARFPLQLAAGVAAIILFLAISPTITGSVSPTNTPTATHTATASPSPFLATPQPFQNDSPDSVLPRSIPLAFEQSNDLAL